MPKGSNFLPSGGKIYKSDGSTFNLPAFLEGVVLSQAALQAFFELNDKYFAIIDFPHKNIHEKLSYSCMDVQNIDGATVAWQVETPADVGQDNPYAHMLFSGITCTGEMLIVVTEGADKNHGTLLDSPNLCRVRPLRAADLIISRGPSGGTTVGDIVIYTKRTGSTGVASKTIEGGGTKERNERILAPSTKYNIAITTFADVWVTLDLGWYMNGVDV